MILNDADNIMLGSTEVSKVYCGDALVWERGGRVVPTGYDEIEYYRTSSYETLNTRMRPTSGTLRYELTYLAHSFSYSNDMLLGGFNSDPYNLRDVCSIYVFIWENGTLGMQEWTGTWHDLYPVGVAPLNTVLTVSGVFSAGYMALTVGGQTYSTTNAVAPLERDVWLCSNGGNGYSPDINVYSLRLWDGGALMRDMVPVQRESDNKYGMWDFVTQDFYPFV